MLLIFFSVTSGSSVRLSAMGIVVIALMLAFSYWGRVAGRQFTLVNQCSHVVWPGIQPGAGHVVLENGGMCLAPETAKTFDAPEGWSGRIWGRHDCTFDGEGGGCATGDCGGALFCNGAGGAPPFSLVEITLSSNTSAPDFYDVSLVDGYNLPVTICPADGGSGQCRVAGCTNDLNQVCPRGLRVEDDGGRVVACKSACFAFNSPEYCCTGKYGAHDTCSPNVYSTVFKTACPSAYSYAFDDATSLVTCAGGPHYVVTFCPAN